MTAGKLKCSLEVLPCCVCVCVCPPAPHTIQWEPRPRNTLLRASPVRSFCAPARPQASAGRFCKIGLAVLRMSLGRLSSSSSSSSSFFCPRGSSCSEKGTGATAAYEAPGKAQLVISLKYLVSEFAPVASAHQGACLSKFRSTCTCFVNQGLEGNVYTGCS